jgi:hypothetical protein
MFLRYKKLTIAVSILFISMLVVVFIMGSKPIDFTTQVKPIINKNCIACHGGVRQKSGFSLLFRDEALAKNKSGKPAIIPGDAENSEIIKRLTNNDPEERMPYKHDPLSKKDIDIIRQWINEGAHWGKHWAYEPIVKVEVPEPKTFFNLISKKSEWAQNPVDNFIEQKLKENDLKPSPQADRSTLLRRVSLDIIGMPPPEHLTKKFLGDTSSHAYQDLVDSLLASPRYGEKWAGMWMDIARYSDTKGYEKDEARTMWRYRDWLIDAFNEDKPYDKFLTEQIAGDLLPNATDSQLIATVFHRNTMTNDEGGTDNEEFRTAAVIDRVNTTWDGVMGTTFGCVQCHSHPYDPFKHEEYYKFLAFFNNSRDEDTQDDYPLLRDYNDTLKQQLSRVVNWVKENASQEKAREAYIFLKTWQPSYNTSICDSFTNGVVGDPTWIVFRNNAICRMKDVDLRNKQSLIFRHNSFYDDGVWKIHLDSTNGEVIANIHLTKTTKGGWEKEIKETDLKPVSGRHDLYFTYTNPNLKNSMNTGVVIDWVHFTDPFPGKGKKDYAVMKDQFWKLLKATVPTTPIMMENPSFMHRASYVFERGNWLVKGKKVEPDVPNSLNPFPNKAPRNRLGLAMWLTSKQNPLTARTMVNRIWEQLYGTGLAETLEDLGSQGIPPTHMELLNWLSYQFMNDYNWSIKKLIRTIVLSATYKQDSKISEELLKKDPTNKWYARSSRVRLSAEQIRDQALCISGVMSNKMYGPSVFPFQPKGLWLSPYNGTDWHQSEGEDQYRRGLYTFWKRSAPYPSMITFDGAARNVCTARRIRTNTPLQALTTLNDSAYIDMARHFAYRLQNEVGSDVKKQIATGYQLATFHSISDKSLSSLLNLYNIAFNRFKNDREKTCSIIGWKATDFKPETAALIVVTNALLNLDEVVTKN